MARTNLEQLIVTAELLRPVLPGLVFVGGAVTSLLVTDEAVGAPRATLDVDANAEITSYAVFVIDGRASIVDEVREQALPLREYLRVQFSKLLKTPAFVDALSGYLMPDESSQARLSLILGRMEALTG